MDAFASYAVLFLLGGVAILLAVLFVAALGKWWFRLIFALSCIAGICLIAVYAERHMGEPPSRSSVSSKKYALPAYETKEKNTSRAPVPATNSQDSPQIEVQAKFQKECKAGWFKALNVDTKIKLSCLRENESFEISCPTITPKANGLCQVRWFENGQFVSKLITFYKDGAQTSDTPTYATVTEKYPYYTKTLSRSEWDGFSSAKKRAINYEAWRESVCAKDGEKRYRYPQSLKDVQ